MTEASELDPREERLREMLAASAEKFGCDPSYIAAIRTGANGTGTHIVDAALAFADEELEAYKWDVGIGEDRAAAAADMHRDA